MVAAAPVQGRSAPPAVALWMKATIHRVVPLPPHRAVVVASATAPPGCREEVPDVASFDIVLRDGSTERVDDADAYDQEGQLTTFFATDGGRGVIDAWSTRLASFRTAEVVVVRRLTSARRLEAVPSA